MPHIIIKRFALFAIPIALVVITVIFIFLAPATLYFDFYSLFSPKAISVNNKSILWGELKSELDLVSADKSLKNRQQKLERAIDKAIERQLLRQTLATESAALAHLSYFDQYRELKTLIEKSLIDRRSGEYFIVVTTPREVTESAEVLKKQAGDEITKIQAQLKNGENFKTVYAEAEKNPVIKKLNFGYFLPGMYLENVTEKDFPIQPKSFREAFFKLREEETSDILILPWNEPEETSNARPNGEFAYAVIKMEKVSQNQYKSYGEWLGDQKQQAKIQSFIPVPFYFRWLSK